MNCPDVEAGDRSAGAIPFLSDPRLPTGKLYKKPLRDAYWRGHGGSRIV